MDLLTPEDVTAGRVPDAWASRIEVVTGGLRVSGSPTGAHDVFLYADERGLAIARSAAEIVAHLRAIGAQVALERESICFLVQTGFVVYPRTIFAGVFLLGIGDVAHVTVRDRALGLRFEVDFPWFRDRSSESLQPDTRRLRDLVTQATARAMEGAPSPVLLMSSGKDSTAVAMGAAAAGSRDLHCLTFVAGRGVDEHLDARRFCEQFGLRHSAIPLPDQPDVVSRRLVELYTNSEMPCADQSQIAYHSCLVEAGVAEGHVLDGAGNDVYMGHVPSKRDLRILRWSLGRSALTDRLRPLFDHAARANFFLQTRTETMFPGYYLRHLETQRFFSQSVDTAPFWIRTSAAYRDRDIFDLRAVTRGRHYDLGAQVLKARGAVQARRSMLLEPFTDPDLVDYYFNLPQADRFDREKLVNKVTLRKMLRSEIGYDDAAIGKRVFAFDAPGVLLRNRDFVRDEICGCRLWSPSIAPMVESWLDRLPTRPRFSQALLGLLALSGWVNRARILRGEVPPVVETPMDATP
jgi:asparagine synthase (glutamine-hydrolysing)